MMSLKDLDLVVWTDEFDTRAVWRDGTCIV